jgi:hypothetical protein
LPLDCQEQIKVCLVDMDHAEEVNAINSCVFEYHHVDNLLPSVKDITMADAEVYALYHHLGY